MLMIYLAKGIKDVASFQKIMSAFKKQHSSPRDFVFILSSGDLSKLIDFPFKGYAVILNDIPTKIHNDQLVKGLDLYHLYDNIFSLEKSGKFSYGNYEFQVDENGIYIDNKNLFDDAKEAELLQLPYIDEGSKYVDANVYYQSLGSKLGIVGSSFECTRFLSNKDGTIGPVTEEELPEYFYESTSYLGSKYLSTRNVKKLVLVKYFDDEGLNIFYEDGYEEKLIGKDVDKFLSCYKYYNPTLDAIRYGVLMDERKTKRKRKTI